MSSEWVKEKFGIRWDVYGRGVPEVVLYVPGTRMYGESMPLSEAERRGIVSSERAERAREFNRRIREAVERVRKEAKGG